MAQFIQQNWIGIIFIVAMLAMHLGGHRHRGHAAHGGMKHGGCGSGHAGHRTREQGEHAHHGSTTRRQAPADSTRDASRPESEADAVPADPARDAAEHCDEPVRPDLDARGLPHTPHRQPH